MPDILTPDQATFAGLRPLTVGYQPQELHMAIAVLADLRRGGIRAALVSLPGGAIEVWRDSASWIGPTDPTTDPAIPSLTP